MKRQVYKILGKPVGDYSEVLPEHWWLEVDETEESIPVDLLPYQLKSEKGIANGYAPLNSSAQIPSAYLPSYVDDIIECYEDGGVLYEDDTMAVLIVGEIGKIYVNIYNNSRQWRWTGSAFIQITNGFIATTQDLVEGSYNLFFEWFRVRDTILTGFNNSLTGIVSATDTVLNAFGKLQSQITDLTSTKVSNTSWYNYVGTTISGFSGTPTKFINYKVVDNIAHIHFYISGPSNSVAVTFTLPGGLLPQENISIPNCAATNNGTLQTANAVIVQNAGSNIVTIKLSNAVSSWNTGGTKTVSGQYFFRLGSVTNV